MTGDLRDIVLSALLGGALIVLFASTMAFAWLLAFGLARVRTWWGERRSRRTDPP
jgi:hypothetical protein